MTDIELAKRVEKLERENRLLKRSGFVTVVVVAGVLLLGVGRPAAQPNVIECQQIILRDPANGNRAVLDGEGLTLYSANGRVRVELKEGKTGPKGMEVFPGDWLKLYDDTGRPGVELTEGDAPADFLQGFTKVESTGNLVMLDYERRGVSAANLGVGKANGLWLTKTRLKRGSAWPEANDVDAALMIDGGSAGVQVQEHGNARIGLFSKSGMPGLDECETYGVDFTTGRNNTRSDYEQIDPKGKAFLRPVEWRRMPNPISGDYPFTLITGRVVYHFHTRTKKGRSRALNGRVPHPYVEIHPADAARLEIGLGDLVEITSPNGQWEGVAMVVDTVRPGEVFVPFHYGHGSQSANQHTWYARDPVSQQPQLKSSPVAVRRLSFGQPEPWLLARLAELKGESKEPFAAREFGGAVNRAV